MTKPSRLQQAALKEPSIAQETLGCLGVILGSLFLFVMGLVGIGLTIFGLIVGNPWFVGLGIGLATTGLSVGAISLGFDCDGLSGASSMFDASTGLAGWLSGRGILFLSVTFALVLNCIMLIFFRPAWETWVSAFAFPALMIVILALSFTRRKPGLDDVA